MSAVQIKSTAQKDDRIIKIKLNTNKNAKKIEISLTKDFTVSTFIDVSNEVKFDICKTLIAKSNNNTCKDGEYTLYARIFNPYGMFSETVSTNVTINPNDKITTTQQAPNKTKTTINSIFAGELSTGSQSREVIKLQQFLSTLSPEIYPEKKVTGFFGPLTEKAVKNFQLKYGVVKNEKEKGFGVVGPKTRAKLNELI